MIFNVATDFSKTPGGRYIEQGSYSGEYFRENYLKPIYDFCLEKDDELTINLDGGYGYGSGFLEEVFGGMVREGYDGEIMLRKINIITKDQPELEDKIVLYIKNAMKSEKKSKKRIKKIK